MQIVIFKLVFCDQKVSLIECMYFHRVLSEQIVYCLHSCDIKCLHILLSYLESLKLIGVKLWQVSIVFLSLKSAPCLLSVANMVSFPIDFIWKGLETDHLLQYIALSKLWVVSVVSINTSLATTLL